MRVGGGLDEGLSPAQVGWASPCRKLEKYSLERFHFKGKEEGFSQSVYFLSILDPSFSGRLLGILTARAEHIHSARAVRVGKRFYFGLLAQPLTEA